MVQQQSLLGVVLVVIIVQRAAPTGRLALRNPAACLQPVCHAHAPQNWQRIICLTSSSSVPSFPSDADAVAVVATAITHTKKPTPFERETPLLPPPQLEPGADDGEGGGSKMERMSLWMC